MRTSVCAPGGRNDARSQASFQHCVDIRPGLEAKGWLAHEQIGNSYRYHAVADAGEYRDKSLRGLIDRFFGRSYISFVSSLVREEKISTTELRELIEQIEAQKEKEKEG